MGNFMTHPSLPSCSCSVSLWSRAHGVNSGFWEMLSSCPPLSPASFPLCSQILSWPLTNRWIISPRPWGRRQNCIAKSLGIRLPPSAGSKMMHLWSRSLGGSPFGQPTMDLGSGLETWTPRTPATSSVWRQTARRWFPPLESCLSSSVSSFLLGMAFGPEPPWGWRGREWACTGWTLKLVQLYPFYVDFFFFFCLF